MPLPNTEFSPPGLTVAKICKNCKFYNYSGIDAGLGWNGVCRLEQLKDSNTKPRPIHGTCACDAHVFKRIGVTVHKLCEKYNLTPPDIYAT